MPKPISSVQIARRSLGSWGPACGFREGTGTTTSDDAALVPAGTLRGNAAWVSTANGPIIRTTAQGDFVEFPTDPDWSPDSTEITVVVGVKPTAFTGTTGPQSAYFHQSYPSNSSVTGIWNVGTGGEPGRVCGVIRDVATPFFDSTLVLSPNVPVVLVLRGKQDAPVVLQAFDRATGVQVGPTQTSTVSLPSGRITPDPGNPYYLGRFTFNGGTRDAPGDYEFLFMSPTYLTDAQVASFVADPYANYASLSTPGQKPAADAIFSATTPLSLAPAYGMREGAGTSTADDAGLAPPAEFQGNAAWASTPGGPVVRTAAPGDYLEIPYVTNYPFDALTDALTAIVGFKPTEFASDYRAAFHKRIGFGSTTLGLMNSTTGGAFQGAIGGVVTPNGPDLSVGTAYIGVVRGQRNGPVNLRIYDRATGQLVGTEVVSTTNLADGPVTVQATNQPVRIGRLYLDNGNYVKDLPGDYEFFFYSPTYLSNAQLDAFAADPYANYTPADATSFSVSPATASTGVTATITATGTNTSWTSGTTFSATGGTGASILGLSVNVGAQTATFTLNPGSAAGTLTISNSTDSATATVAVAMAFDWLAALEAAMNWAATGQPNAYPQLPGYAGDADDHYDPVGVFEQVRAYTGSSSWDVQIDAALDHYREQGLLAKGGHTMGHHAYADGLLAHHERTGDTKSRDAAILVARNAAGSDDGRFIDESYPSAGSREVAFSIGTKLVAEALGCAHRPRLEQQVAAALGHIAQWTAPPSSRYWITYCRPFMAGLTMEALVKYWTKYRNAPDTGPGSPGDLVAQIPAAIKSLCAWLWANTWHGEPYGGWDHGGFQYTDVDLSVTLAPIDSTVTSVTSATTIRGDSSLSAQEDYFRFATITFTSGPLSGLSFGCTGYVGSTREFRLEYPANALTGDPGVGSTFQVSYGSNPAGLDLSNAADLNALVAPAYAWCGWHDKVVLGLSSTPYLDQFEAIMRGASTIRPGGMHAQKVYNQTFRWSLPGLRWFQRATAEYPEATAITLTGPGTAGRVNAMSDRFTVALAGASGPKFTAPGGVVKVTLEDDSDGDFFPPVLYLSAERPRATSRYRPGSSGAKSISATNDGGLTNPAAVPYTPVGTAAFATGVKPVFPVATGPATPPVEMAIALDPPGSVPPVGADSEGGVVILVLQRSNGAHVGYDDWAPMYDPAYSWASGDNPSTPMRLFLPPDATGSSVVTAYNYMGLPSPTTATYTIGMAPTFSVSPATATAGTPVTVTATGSNTSWTLGTTFSVTGGTSASISNSSVDVAAQTATFTLNPGSAAGTLMIANRTDSVTAMVTVNPGAKVPPKVLSATVDETGTLLTLVFSISVIGGTGFTLSERRSLSTPSVLNCSLTYKIAQVVLRDEDLTLAYTLGDVADATDANNGLEEFSAVVVNHSIQPKPAIPRNQLFVPRHRNRARPFGGFR